MNLDTYLLRERRVSFSSLFHLGQFQFSFPKTLPNTDLLIHNMRNRLLRDNQNRNTNIISIVFHIMVSISKRHKHFESFNFKYVNRVISNAFHLIKKFFNLYNVLLNVQCFKY